MLTKGDDSKACPVQRGVNARAGQARQRMANRYDKPNKKYEKPDEIVEFGDYYTSRDLGRTNLVMLPLCESLYESYDGLVISASEFAHPGKPWKNAYANFQP